MPLQAGSRLGGYEILGPLGAGGMGEVYRARDPKLQRDVAIKVLPAMLMQDPAARARFEREAQAVAALSHPNIVAIHDFAIDGQTAYAVTELLEGETLRARLDGQPLPVRKAIDLAVPIVRGIAAAHERGIIHRDLKPENIFVTRGGVVKILDFGLAKTAGEVAAVAAAGETRSLQTAAGTVLGTAGYMSPEQVRAQPLDHRTDIFSFGAILYEMLTGRRAFSGDSQVETMNAILKEDPPEFAEINPNLPGALDRLVRRCLEKQPADRFHSAHDLAIALEALSGSSSTSAAERALAGAGPRRKLPLATAAAAAVAVGAAVFVADRTFLRPSPPVPPEFSRLTFRNVAISSAQMMPDGATAVYSAGGDDGPQQIYTVRIGSPDPTPLPYQGADIVSVSSQGELALVKRPFAPADGWTNPGTLRRGTLGGAARDVLENVQDADWMPDGSTFAVSHFVDNRFRLEFPIGRVVYETSGWIDSPRVSRDGKTIAFLDHPLFGDDRGTAAYIDAAGTKHTLSAPCESAGGLAWSVKGDEVWYTCAQRGNSRELEAATLDGRQRTLLRVPGSLRVGGVAADGTVLLAVVSARRGVSGLMRGETRERDLSWLDWTYPRTLSEDGTTLLFTEQGDGGGAGYGVYARKLDGSPAVRLGTGDGWALSTDGRWVIAQVLNPPPAQLRLLPTGAGEARVLTNDTLSHERAVFLPDGKRFLFVGAEPGKSSRVWVQGLVDGARAPVTPEGVTGLVVMPDGSRVACLDNGVYRLYRIDGKGAPEALPFIESAEILIRFTADGQSMLVRRPPAPDRSVDVVRVNLTTGARAAVRTVRPVPGSRDVRGTLLTSDGAVYVNSGVVFQSDLFLVKGLR